MNFNLRRGRQCIFCAVFSPLQVKVTSNQSWHFSELEVRLPSLCGQSAVYWMWREFFLIYKHFKCNSASKTVVLSKPIHVRTIVQNINSENMRIWNFLPSVCSQFWWNLHTPHDWRTGSGRRNERRINTAGRCALLQVVLSAIIVVVSWFMIVSA